MFKTLKDKIHTNTHIHIDDMNVKPVLVKVRMWDGIFCQGPMINRGSVN